ncbi:MAG TPA: DNA mismatch repair protein MutS, partial [Dehalococcoidia bacterium]|nr:DNA mismatch repair protein MutS [Dehalococcoidia bacterium]
MGDFYETFDEDAQIASRDLEIVLTQREMGHGEIVPLAGIPYHALENYLAKLLKKGHRVAIAEQTSTPDGKGIVDRSVTRVVTPGTILESNLLESSANNYLAAVIRHSNHAAIAHVDISTGEFGVTQIEANLILEELARLSPSEVIINENDAEIAEILQDKYKITLLYADNFKYRTARQSLLQLYKVKTLDAYGCESLELAIAAAGAVLAYLKETHPLSLTHLGGLYTYSIDEFMTIDPQTRRNLELFEGGQWGTAEQSLLKVLNLTYTPMGARVLRNWVGQPLLDVNALNQRLDAVEWFHTS